MSLRLILRAFALASGAAVAAFGLGFAWFARDATLPSPWPSHVDGIVALTGGTQRVPTALALLRAGVSGRLLISGVGPGVTLPALLQNNAGDHAVTSVAASPPIDSITLGHAAQTTAGNAVETTWWVRANGMRSIVVVTAGYHMRRALAEIDAALPDVRVTPYAVHPPAGARTLFVEYVKLLASEAGIHPLAPMPGTT